MNGKEAFRRHLTIARMACLTVCPFFVLLALAFAIHTTLFLHGSASAAGTIVSLNPIHDTDNNLNYAPVFTFNAANERTYTISSNTASNPPEFAVGDKVKVLYKPDDPVDAKIDNFVQLWFFAVCFGFVGAGVGLIGYVLLRNERRKSAKKLLSSQGTVAAP